MSLQANRKDYAFFRNLIVLEPIAGQEEKLEELIQNAKNIIADMAVRYFHRDEPLENCALSDPEENSSIEIKNEEHGVHIVQKVSPDVEESSKIYFGPLGRAYFAQEDDLETLLEAPTSKIVPCTSSFTLIRDQVVIEPLHEKTDPYINMAKNFIASAAIQWSETKKIENIPSYKTWDIKSPTLDWYDWSVSLSVYMNGASVYQTYPTCPSLKKHTTCTSFHYELFKKISGTLIYEIKPEEALFRNQICLPPLNEVMKPMIQEAIEIIFRAAINYSRTKGQMIQKHVSLKSSLFDSKVCAVSIKGEKGGVRVWQLYRYREETEENCIWIEFPVLKREGS